MGSNNTSSPNIPEIVIQIVHIEGPRKGEIDELSGLRISIGRDPTCDIAFPKDLLTISRHHAEIIREGNRFLLKNLGKNGTYVNGQLASEIYLKQGDVITFAQGGPKVSFLYTFQNNARPRTSGISSSRTPKSATQPRTSPVVPPRTSPVAENLPKESAPFTIQYGTSIRSFKQHSVKLGKEPACHFQIEHPRVLGTHAEVYYQQKQYYLRDLSGCNATFLNGRPIHTETPLQTNDVIMFNEGGPKMKYLGEGRLAEVLEFSSQQPSPQEVPSISVSRDDITTQKEPSVKDLLKSFFKK